MSTLTLNLDNLGDLANGSTKPMIDSDIAMCVADLDQHGNDGKVREVTIKLKMWVDEASKEKRLVITSKPSLPARMSAETRARTKVDKGKARLLFEDDQEDEADPEKPQEDKRESE